MGGDGNPFINETNKNQSIIGTAAAVASSEFVNSAGRSLSSPLPRPQSPVPPSSFYFRRGPRGNLYTQHTYIDAFYTHHTHVRVFGIHLGLIVGKRFQSISPALNSPRESSFFFSFYFPFPSSSADGYCTWESLRSGDWNTGLARGNFAFGTEFSWQYIHIYTYMHTEERERRKERKKERKKRDIIQEERRGGAKDWLVGLAWHVKVVFWVRLFFLLFFSPLFFRRGFFFCMCCVVFMMMRIRIAKSLLFTPSPLHPLPLRNGIYKNEMPSSGWMDALDLTGAANSWVVRLRGTWVCT
ncbi:hypothetical protein F4779DRAFT_461175 [Xylariaceae sp. FL0662B]|nr:hypothetical protein F4779DRAFT_461175 [Xylariaceae sp. FL0662B]